MSWHDADECAACRLIIYAVQTTQISMGLIIDFSQLLASDWDAHGVTPLEDVLHFISVKDAHIQ